MLDHKKCNALYDFKGKCIVSASLGRHNVVDVKVRAEDFPADHDSLFKLMSDPTCHARIFDSIEVRTIWGDLVPGLLPRLSTFQKGIGYAWTTHESATSELVFQEGPVKRYRLEYQSHWNFWKLHGTCESRLIMETDSAARTVSFRLREPGFFKTFEGTWSIAPAVPVISVQCPTPALHPTGPSDLFGTRSNPLAHIQLRLQPGTGLSSNISNSIVCAPPRSVVHIHNKMSTQISAPYPLSLTLKGHGVRQAKDMLKGLLEATTPLVEE